MNLPLDDTEIIYCEGSTSAASGAWSMPTTAAPVFRVAPPTLPIPIRDTSQLPKPRQVLPSRTYIQSILAQIPSSRPLSATELKALSDFLGRPESDFQYNTEDLYDHDEY